MPPKILLGENSTKTSVISVVDTISHPEEQITRKTERGTMTILEQRRDLYNSKFVAAVMDHKITCPMSKLLSPRHFIQTFDSKP